MRTLKLVASILFLALVATGCDKSGIHSLGVARNVTANATSPTTAWLRSTDLGTEVLLIGVPNEGDVPGVATPTDHLPFVFTRGFVAHDSSTTLDQGTYSLGAGGTGTFSTVYQYTFPYEPGKAVLSRQGASRQDLMPPKDEALAIALDGSKLLVTFDGAQHRYVRFSDLVDSIDPSSPEAGVAMFTVFNLPLFLSQVRVPGFGGTGMVQYADSRGTFEGLINGHFTVLLESLTTPIAHIDYTDFIDLDGIRITGEQISDVNLSGDGTMHGVLPWSVFGGPANAVIASGSTDYKNIVLKNGLATGGTYEFTIDGAGTTSVPFSKAYDVDLRNVLPVTTP